MKYFLLTILSAINLTLFGQTYVDDGTKVILPGENEQQEAEKEQEEDVEALIEMLDQGYGLDIYDNTGKSYKNVDTYVNFLLKASKLLNEDATMDDTSAPVEEDAGDGASEGTGGEAGLEKADNAVETAAMAGSLLAKASKIAITIKTIGQKSDENELHKTELQKWSESTKKVYDQFKDYYEKYKIVRDAIKYFEEIKKFAETTANLTGKIIALRTYVLDNELISENESKYIISVTDGMLQQIAKEVEASKFSIWDSQGEKEEEKKDKDGETLWTLIKDFDRSSTLDASEKRIFEIWDDYSVLNTHVKFALGNRKLESNETVKNILN